MRDRMLRKSILVTPSGSYDASDASPHSQYGSGISGAFKNPRQPPIFYLGLIEA
jgi:hypothetical protein